MVMTPAAAFLAIGLALASQDPEQVQKLIQTLGDPGKEERDKAVADLVRIGRPALEALRKATSSSDAEVKALAAQAIEKIEWGGAEKLKQYIKEHLDEGAALEPSKVKGPAKWFPDIRFYEASAGAPVAGGAAAIMGMQAPRSLFAVRKFEDGFHRILVKGIYCPVSIRTLIRTQKIVLADENAAVDFALVFMDLYSAGVSQNMTVMMMGGGGASRLEKTADGWALEATGTSVTFKTDKDGALLDVVSVTNPYSMFGLGGGGEKRPEELTKLEIEKLKLEVELLKRQLEKK